MRGDDGDNGRDGKKGDLGDQGIRGLTQVSYMKILTRYLVKVAVLKWKPKPKLCEPMKSSIIVYLANIIAQYRSTKFN